MDERFIDLYGEYAQALIDRREFLRRLSVLAGCIVATNALLPLLENNYAKAEVVRKDDPRLYIEDIKYPGVTGEVGAYLVKPKVDEELPGVVIIHENRGLNPHIQDVTRRVALNRFLGIAPDALSPFGGTPEDPDKAVPLIQRLDNQATMKDYLAAVRYLKTQPASTGKVGCIGFCWGGGIANQLAVNSPDLSAVVSFYGRQPASQDVPKIKASLLLHYAGLDEGINRGIPSFEAALKEASISYKMYMYEGANHAFFNDTNAARYNKEAAHLAWERTISFLKEKLKK